MRCLLSLVPASWSKWELKISFVRLHQTSLSQSWAVHKRRTLQSHNVGSRQRKQFGSFWKMTESTCIRSFSKWFKIGICLCLKGHKRSHDFTVSPPICWYTTSQKLPLKRANSHLITSLRNESSEKGQILIQLKYEMPQHDMRKGSNIRSGSVDFWK